MEGWIKLYRRFQDWEWYDDANMVKLFVHLMLSANIEDKSWRGIPVKRGQLVTGRKALSEAVNLSEQTLRTCLERLKSTNEITIKSTNKYSVLTICNFDTYQSVEIPTNQQLTSNLTNQQPATNQQLTTTKEGKKVKKERVNIPAWEEFLNYALTKKPLVDQVKLKFKYEAWVENKWKDGLNNPIKNWKSKLLNTLPYIEEGKPQGLWDLKKEDQSNFDE